MTYGQMIKVARKRKGWTTKTLRERLGGDVSSAYLTKVEVHDEIPSPPFTCKIAEVLDIDLIELVEAAKEGKRRMFNELLDRKWEGVSILYRRSASSSASPSETPQ